MINSRKIYESWNIRDWKVGPNHNAKTVKFFKRVANKVTRKKLKLELVGEI